MITAREVGEAMIAARPVRRMERMEAEVLMGLTLMKHHGKEDGAISGDPQAPLGFKIAAKRFGVHGVPVEDRVSLFIATISDRPGTVMLYVAAVKALYDRLKRKVTLEDFVEAFPAGFPEEPQLKQIWESQKVLDGQCPDNALDRAEAWAA